MAAVWGLARVGASELHQRRLSLVDLLPNAAASPAPLPSADAFGMHIREGCVAVPRLHALRGTLAASSQADPARLQHSNCTIITGGTAGGSKSDMLKSTRLF